MQNSWVLRLATFSLWLLAAGSVVFWVLKFVDAPASPAAAANALAVGAAGGTVVADSTLVAKALGGGNAPVVEATAATPKVTSINGSRFVLTGVVAAAQNVRRSAGLALIAIDGKPARPYQIGALLEDGVLLKEVTPRSAVLASSLQDAGGLTLELPKKPITAGNVAPALAYGAAATPAAPPPLVMPGAPAIAAAQAATAAAAASVMNNPAIAPMGDPHGGRSLANRLRAGQAGAAATIPAIPGAASETQ
jgi:general secretion pathway protein C